MIGEKNIPRIIYKQKNAKKRKLHSIKTAIEKQTYE